MPKKVSFFVDGFNLYHSVCDALDRNLIRHGKWLDLSGLCTHCLHLFGHNAILQDIFYFSAFAYHTKDPAAPKRHDQLIQAFQTMGIKTVLGRFKKKQIKCRAKCKQTGWGYEEKETDVNIAVHLIEELTNKTCDIAVIVSGDTDLSAAIKVAKRMFPSQLIACAFPYGRSKGRSELKNLCHRYFNIEPDAYERFCLPDQITLLDGYVVKKPPMW